MEKTRTRKSFVFFQTDKKPMLLRNDNRAAGEFEGARPASSWIIAIKNVRQDFLTSEARFFVKRKLHKKCGVLKRVKRATGFFDTLRKNTNEKIVRVFSFQRRLLIL